MNSKVKSILRIIFYPLLTLKRNYYMHNLRNAVYNNPKKSRRYDLEKIHGAYYRLGTSKRSQRKNIMADG